MTVENTDGQMWDNRQRWGGVACRQGRKGRGESKTGVKSECLVSVSVINSNPGFVIFSNLLFKEVCFALEANCLHPFEQVVGVVVSVTAKV